jgi:ActR/RegA family two-component response regulator
VARLRGRHAFHRLRERLQRAFITRGYDVHVAADCGGNISEAARRLGMHRRSLQRKLQKRPPRA